MPRVRRGMLLSGIERRRQPEPAAHLCGQVREDVAEHVGREHDIEPVRVAVERGGHRVHGHVFQRDVGELGRHRLDLADEQPVGELEHMLLLHHRDVAAAGARHPEGDARDPARGARGDPAHRQRDILGRHELGDAGEHVAVGVEALGVLAHDDEVHRRRRLRQAGPGARRADIGIEIEPLAQRARHADPALLARRIGGHLGRAEHDTVGRLGGRDHRVRQGRAMHRVGRQADLHSGEPEPVSYTHLRAPRDS